MVLDHNKALDLAREGQWDEAHTMISPFTDTMSCLIHPESVTSHTPT
jgi:hypothetical protein